MSGQLEKIENKAVINEAGEDKKEEILDVNNDKKDESAPIEQPNEENHQNPVGQESSALHEDLKNDCSGDKGMEMFEDIEAKPLSGEIPESMVEGLKPQKGIFQ